MSYLKDNLIKAVIKKVITDSNRKIDFTELILKNGSQVDLNKKLVINITDMDSVNGIGLQDGKLVEVISVSNPDTIFNMTKNTFSSIILGKVDHRQAYFMGAIDTNGKDWLRDSILLGKVFDEVQKAMHSMRCK